MLGGIMVFMVRSSSWRQLDRIESEFAAIRSESFYLGLKLREGIGRLNEMVLRSQLSKSDLALRERFLDESARLEELARRTAPHLTTDEQRDSLRQFNPAFATYLTNLNALIERPVRAVRRDSAAQVYDEIDACSQPALERCQHLIAAQSSAWNAFVTESQSALASLQNVLRVSTWALLGLVLAVVLLMHRLLVRPLQARLSQSEALVERKAKLASLGTLAAGVAHEIRNPLAAIKFRLFSLKKALPAGLGEQEDLRIIDGEINRLERIVQEFLQFARPSEPIRKDIAVDQLLRDVQDLMRPQFAQQGVQLKIESPEGLLICADRQQMLQVLINLMQNGAESMEPGGRLLLTARAGTGRWAAGAAPAVVLEVSDDGKGIPAEVEPRLFDPFFSTKDGGTGLGLPIAARIVELHGGLLQYQTQLNRGTTFQVILPRLTNHASPHPAH
jgi:signal transduction histidine kinase